MRLIDADALFEDCIFSSLELELGLKEFINDAPTIDAVSVVRCKDCMSYENGICKYWNILSWYKGYCHMGERKDDDKR